MVCGGNRGQMIASVPATRPFRRMLRVEPTAGVFGRYDRCRYPATRSGRSSESTATRQGVTVVARSRTGLVALVLAAGLAMAGCTGSGEPKSGVALEIGDRTVSVDELQAEVEQLRQSDPNANLGENEAASVQQSLISQKILDELHTELISQAGLSAERAQVEELKRQFRQQLKQSDQSLPESVIDEAARRQVRRSQIPQALLGDDFQQQLQQNPDLDLNKLYDDRMQELAGELRVEVNPRYGAFDPKTDFVRALQGDPVIDARGGQLAEFSEPQAPEQPIVGQ